MAQVTVAKFKTFLSSIFEYGGNELKFNRDELMEMFVRSHSPSVLNPGPSDAPEPADNPVDYEEHQLAEKQK